MSCEVLGKIGTGDCESKICCKNETNVAQIIASELVSEILENALDIVEDCEQEKSTKIVGDILDTLANKFQEMNISEENKKAVKLACDKEGNCLKGVGDQLEGEEEILKEDLTRKHPPVEKKNRLTDLVKNSKHVLAKLILNEHRDHEEMKNEKTMRVIDLDTGEGAFKVKKKIAPESIPLPPSDSHEILNAPVLEETMDEIQLYGTPEAKYEAKSDRYKKTMTFPLAAGSGKSLSLAARCRTLKFPVDLKKKKWNLGSKIVNYIRKHHKKDDGKDGVEIQPKKDSD